MVNMQLTNEEFRVVADALLRSAHAGITPELRDKVETLYTKTRIKAHKKELARLRRRRATRDVIERIEWHLTQVEYLGR